MTSAERKIARKLIKLTALLSAAGMALGLSACMTTSSPEGAVLKIDSGAVQGNEHGEMHSYLGIPYAAAPVGDLRWRPPQQPPSWTSPLDATEYGNSCPQNADLGVFAKAGGNEDCLNLNVFVSKKSAESKKKLPVLVWIHGGALAVGGGGDYDPSKLAVDGGMVVVTINYRLGLLGYFADPALDREGHPFGNYGLMDQQFALDWVQRNIATFGGDPGNVTISGESSGGNSVLAHVASPLSSGKFQHAIPMSGAAIALQFPVFGAPRPLDVAERTGTDFTKAVGCGSRGPECLRELPLNQILATQSPYLINQVIIDGRVIPTHPAEAFKSGKFNHVTLINGSTRDEGTFFAGFPENESGAPLTAPGYPGALDAYFGPLTQDVLKEYPLDAFSNPSEALGAAVTDMQFACPGRAINRWMADQTPTYAFEFSDRTAPSYLNPTTFALGAAHTFELAYLFPRFHGGAGNPIELNPLQEKLSDKMVDYWSNAAGAEDREEEWPQYSPAEENTMSLILPEPRMDSQSFGHVHNCDFWDARGIY
ncbi:carboxylesterase/lipase family protein [Rhodococcus sp. NPDC057529]|uniref:carboxylesterase/lipase family protein n=1 Tax=Rhodococcus sp. NPDC057529 TaxID=3346158 RepID=UPI00366C2DC3